MSGSFEDELKETDETLTEEFTCIVTLISLFVVDSYLEGVLCAACRRCVELFKFCQPRLATRGEPRWRGWFRWDARRSRRGQLLEAVRQNQCLKQRPPDHVLAESPPRSFHLT